MKNKILKKTDSKVSTETLFAERRNPQRELAETNRKFTRHRLPNTRESITHKFQIGADHKGYVTVGLYDDGKPGEVFIKMSKEGSTISGLTDTIGILTSLALQYGIPLDALINKLSHSRFEPSGFTANPHIRFAKSPVDYIFRWLEGQFSDQKVQDPTHKFFSVVGNRFQ